MPRIDPRPGAQWSFSAAWDSRRVGFGAGGTKKDVFLLLKKKEKKGISVKKLLIFNRMESIDPAKN
jgi:hypothetical protein